LVIAEPTVIGDLHGSRALVTGGSHGIGRATASLLADLGCEVGIVDLDPDSLGVPQRFRSVVRADLRKAAEVEAAVGATLDALGGLDILVNNAGVNAYFDPIELREDEWDAFMAIDLKAAWLCAKHALPAMFQSAASRGDAAVVNVSSIQSRLTTEGMFPYAAAKSGVEGLTRSLALECGPRGVRVNAIAPGYTRTRLLEEWLESEPDSHHSEKRLLEVHPLRRIATPREIACVIAFLASPAARALTGAVVAADCGLGIRFAT
jgi:NAD(P)-dependent dehydrogenase (short-subunit alcohol dehydrogenase family)